MLYRILLVGLLAGLIAGTASTALQLAWAVPLIKQAEAFEQAAVETGHGARSPGHDGHTHGDDGHAHDAPWAPADGASRSFWTLLSNVSLGAGAGFILAALFALRPGALGARRGLLWGLAAFASVGIAPALGLPPELPGTLAAPIEARQIWWLLTAGCTATGLALLFGRRPAALRAAGVALLLVPHLVGAPQPQTHAALAPLALQREFIVAALACSGLFWLVLGTTAGVLGRRFGLSLDDAAGEPAGAGASASGEPGGSIY